MLPVVKRDITAGMDKSILGVGAVQYLQNIMKIMGENNPEMLGFLGDMIARGTRDNLDTDKLATFVKGFTMAYMMLHSQDEANELEKQWSE